MQLSKCTFLPKGCCCSDPIFIGHTSLVALDLDTTLMGFLQQVIHCLENVPTLDGENIPGVTCNFSVRNSICFITSFIMSHKVDAHVKYKKEFNTLKHWLNHEIQKQSQFKNRKKNANFQLGYGTQDILTIPVAQRSHFIKTLIPLLPFCEVSCSYHCPHSIGTFKVTVC
jgi:hypothetical protein